jgi:hypothetical protein
MTTHIFYGRYDPDNPQTYVVVPDGHVAYLENHGVIIDIMRVRKNPIFPLGPYFAVYDRGDSFFTREEIEMNPLLARAACVVDVNKNKTPVPLDVYKNIEGVFSIRKVSHTRSLFG